MKIKGMACVQILPYEEAVRSDTSLRGSRSFRAIPIFF